MGDIRSKEVRKKKVNTKAVAFGLVITLVLTIGTVSALSNSGGGDWEYYKEIWIKENSGTSLSDYQVLVALEPSKFPDKAKSDGSDLRFTEDGKELSYWVEEYNVSAKTARIWVNVPNIAANGEAKVKMYYGNPDASAVSDGNATFVFFDDFESGNLSKWSMVQNAEITSTEVYSGAYSLKTHYDNQGLDNDVYFDLTMSHLINFI